MITALLVMAGIAVVLGAMLGFASIRLGDSSGFSIRKLLCVPDCIAAWAWSRRLAYQPSE